MVDIRALEREALGAFLRIESLAEVAGPAPAEEDDGDIQKECDGETGVRYVRIAQSRSEDLASKSDEKDHRRDRRTADDQPTARNSRRTILHASPHVWQPHD